MFSPKSHSVINIIAMVSVIAVAIPTAAMIILLAMFEGINKTIDTIYSAVDADIEIVAERGQTFDSKLLSIEQLESIEGVHSAAPYLEQSVMLATNARRTTVKLRGIDTTYLNVLPISNFVVRGSIATLQEGAVVVGSAVASSLGIPSLNYPVELYSLNRKQLSTLLPTSGISREASRIGGIVSANSEIDESLAIIDLGIAEKLLNYAGRWSGVVLKVESKEVTDNVKQSLKEFVGEGVTVRTREEKSAEMNALISLERFAIILIGTFIAIIAAFAIVGAVVMLITDKHRDIVTLRSMGATKAFVREVFIGEGVLLSVVGCVIGTLIGVGFALGQQHFGWIKIPGNMVFESYPVALTAGDTLLVVAIVLVAGWSISNLTVRARLGKEDKM